MQKDWYSWICLGQALINNSTMLPSCRSLRLMVTLFFSFLRQTKRLRSVGSWSILLKLRQMLLMINFLSLLLFFRFDRYTITIPQNLPIFFSEGRLSCSRDSINRRSLKIFLFNSRMGRTSPILSLQISTTKIYRIACTFCSQPGCLASYTRLLVNLRSLRMNYLSKVSEQRLLPMTLKRLARQMVEHSSWRTLKTFAQLKKSMRVLVMMVREDSRWAFCMFSCLSVRCSSFRNSKNQTQFFSDIEKSVDYLGLILIASALSCGATDVSLLVAFLPIAED